MKRLGKTRGHTKPRKQSLRLPSETKKAKNRHRVNA